jgi:hypothetical protein
MFFFRARSQRTRRRSLCLIDEKLERLVKRIIFDDV